MQLQQLKKLLPFKWRVQSINEYAAVCVAYIDSRDVQDLLDEVVGSENWQSDYKEVKGNVYGGIGIKINSEWVWKWDCGVESKTEAEKGEASDSFKRAAVKWGVGRFLYSLEIVRLKVTEYKGKKYPLNEATGKAIFDRDELTNYINGLSKNVDTSKKTPSITKPNAKPEQIESALKRILSGEEGVLEKMKTVFDLSTAQIEKLTKAV